MDDDCLKGLRVLELADETGQLAGRILADLGADVVKVESAEGDRLRGVGPFFGGEAHPDRGAFWIARNSGKRGATLDLNDAAGAARFRELAAAADVLIETLPPGKLAGIGFDPRELRAGNPGLIVCSITPFGQTGPYSDRRGSDLTVMAACGNAYLTGDPDRAPVRCSMPMAHYHSAAEAAFGILAALWERDRTGAGDHIDVSMHEAMLMANMSMPAQTAETGFRGKRAGSSYRAGNTIQPEIWPCKDGFVSFALRSGKARVPGLVAITEYLDEHGMATPALKQRDWDEYNYNLLTQDEVDELAAPFAELFRTKTMSELYQAACERRLMLAPGNTEREVLASRQLAAREFFTRAEVPGGDQPVAIPERFAKVSFARVRPGLPRLGDSAGFDSADRFEPASPAGRADGAGLFAGLKVVEFGAGAAAPLATRYFGDQGATVVKVESRRRPDFLRTIRDDGSGKLDHSIFFACLNPNKLSAGLNLKDPRGVELAHKLVGWADVVIENFAPGVMQKWELDYATQAQRNPGLVMVSTCLWGQTGPERAYPGFGGQGSALAGFNYLTGWPDRAPLGPFGTVTDSLSPRFAATAIVAALLRRSRTGEGAYIDLSQVETGVYSLTEWLLAYQASGETFGRIGNRSTRAVPHGTFPAAGEDRWVALAVHDDRDWETLCGVMGRPEWATDPSLASVEGRFAAIDSIERQIAEWTAPQEAGALAARLQQAGLDAATVADLQDVRDDPQLAHREHFRVLRHPALGDYMVEANGLRFAGSPMVFDAPAPCLGADSERVYCDLLGIDRGEYEELRQAGVFD